MKTSNLVLTLLLLLLCLPGAAGNVGAHESGSRPFCGVWISNTPEEYRELKIDLYSKSVKVSDETGLTYGYLKTENDFVSDYLVVKTVTFVDGNTASVKCYSLRYGAPNDEQAMEVRFDAAKSEVDFGGNVFTPANLCKYVEVLTSDVNIRTAPKTGTPLGKAGFGMVFDMLGFSGGWYKVRLEDGREGYVADGLSQALLDAGIPQHAFPSDGNIAAKGGSYYVELIRKGDVVLMTKDFSRLQPDGSLRYEGSTVYSGKISGSKIIFTHSGAFFNTPLDNIKPSDLKEREPYVVYFSPRNQGFVVDGKLLVK